jgi:hypothetical protein
MHFAFGDYLVTRRLKQGNREMYLGCRDAEPPPNLSRKITGEGPDPSLKGRGTEKKMARVAICKFFSFIDRGKSRRCAWSRSG